MARTAATSKQDPLGLLAIGSIIVKLAQGEAHSKLAAWYGQLGEKYGSICREYLALRKVNYALQKQAREHERTIDKLRADNGQLQKRLSEGKES